MTDLPRNGDDSLRREVYELADALLTNVITAEQSDRLGELVCNSSEARRHYVRFMHDSAALHQWSSHLSDVAESGVESSRLRAIPLDSDVLSPESSVPFPAIVIDSSPGNLSRFGLNSPLGGMLFSYSISAFFVIVGMLIGLTWKVSEPGLVVDGKAPNSQVRVATLSPSSPKMELVGRITGLVECKFSDDKDILPPLGFAHVPLGRKYKILSGLMEITYDSGAKVILQGPATYQVESARGGYLAIGKLTAKMEAKRDAGRRKAVESGDRRSDTPLFFVRTPTTLVTDLGTEFGVEVDGEGDVRSEVFRGSVKVQIVGEGDKLSLEGIVLSENESIHVEKPRGKNDRQPLVIRRVAAEPQNYVRQLPKSKKSLPIKVLAYFRMGEDDPGAEAGKPAGQYTFNHGRGSRLEKHGFPSYSDDTAAPGSSLAVNFTGKELEYFAGKDLFLTVTEGFILEAWIRVHVIPKEGFLTLVFNGHTDSNGYGLLLHEGKWKVLFPTYSMRDSAVKCVQDQWTHLALVSESGKFCLWVNGRPSGQTFESPTNIPIGSFAIGGNPHVNSEPPFEGRIDEVRLSVFQGPFHRKMLLLPENQSVQEQESDSAKKIDAQDAPPNVITRKS